jgi:hypothetical protein
MFGGNWKCGDLITIIDHSHGFVKHVGSLACTIECILVQGSHFVALVYPVTHNPRDVGRITGSFKVTKRLQLDHAKFFVTNLSDVPDHIHICHLAQYQHVDGSVLQVPLCGPLAEADD